MDLAGGAQCSCHFGAHTEPPSEDSGDESLLLELGVPFGIQHGNLRVEAQALNGIRCWADHFERVTVLAPLRTESPPSDSTVTWLSPEGALDASRVRLEPLPWAYDPLDYFRSRRAVRKRLRALIAAHRYLCFSNLGTFGAWGNLAASEARRLNRPYGLWFDWVVHRMHSGRGGSFKRRLKARVDGSVSLVNTYWAIQGCAVGLFHGKTVYDAYAPLCRQPALVHDVHVGPGDGAPDELVAKKLGSVVARDTLRLGYVGRAHPMKDPLAWIDTMIRVLVRLGPERVEATWIGDGPLLEEARRRVRAEGFEASIRFPGHVWDRAALLEFLRGLDAFVFCHVTPESPRCLIESLISATPIVGYESEYARDLVAGRGGGVFTKMHDVEGLARALCRLADQRGELESLIGSAAASRAIYSDEAVFAHRSALIKAHLP